MEELNAGKVMQYLSQYLDKNSKYEDTTDLLWLGCPICGSNTVADFYMWQIKLTKELELIVVCDGCGREFSIPLNEEDILKYIELGIQQELNEKYN